MRLTISHVPGAFFAGVGVETKAHRFRAQDTYVTSDFVELPLPAGVAGVMRRPVWARFNLGTHSRHYGTGAFTANILVDEWMRMLRQGIKAPTTIPTVALSAGPGPTGQTIPYLRFLDSLGARVSPLSGPGATLAASNNGFTWSTLPTSTPDGSADSLQGLRSMDGALPRLAWTRQLGVTSVVENLATQALGEAHATDFDEPPLCSMSAIYHWAQWLSGHEKFPERVFRSDLFEPERYAGLYVQTDGEPVVGLVVANDTLLFGSKFRIYRATGFDVDDIDREIEKPDVGMISHDANVSVNQRAIIPSWDEVWLYDGGWVPLLRGRQKEWVREYKTFQEQYDRAHGFYDPKRRTYTFGPVQHTEHAPNPGEWVFWTLHCEGVFPDLSTGGFNPRWTIDKMSRERCASTVWTLPGSSQPAVAYGFDDGFIRIQDEEDHDDDGDIFQKAFVVEPAAFRPDPGGGPLDASTFHKLWSYFQSEDQDWLLEVRTGGPHCRTRLNPDFSDPMPFSGQNSFEEVETLHAHVLEQCVGSVIQPKYIVQGPLGVRFNGWGLTWGRGVHTRGKTGTDPG